MSLKKWIKRKLNTGNPISTLQLKERVQAFDVVSFDLFDTLLKRKMTDPEDVFRYIESYYNIPHFLEKRINAERLARKKSDACEVTLQEIYDEYGTDYSAMELQVEKELLMVNDDLLDLYQYCLKEKRVILISDMYLPYDFLRNALHDLGLDGYECLLLSSKEKKVKRDGSLFHHALAQCNINALQMIHIGDSLCSDYKIPKSLGIEAIHIPTYTPKSEYQLPQKTIEANMINAFLNHTSKKTMNPYERFGYERFGMFLWGYCKWLHNSLKKEHIQKVYFFSRDGLIMKNAFDILYQDVQTYYLEVSRRSLRVPVLWKNHSFEMMLNILSPSKLISISMIFDCVGLKIDDYEGLLNQFGYTKESVFDRKTIAQQKRLRDLYDSLSGDIEKNSRKEYQNLAAYIKQESLGGRFAVVDIGWSGGMQRFLDETLTSLNIYHEIKGYYIGVAEYCKRNLMVMPNLDLNGYLFDFCNDSNAVDKRSPFVGLFETLFLERAGSVCNYSIKKDGSVVANRLPYEYRIDGQYSDEYKCVEKIQQGSLNFVKRFGNIQIDVLPSILFSGIEQVGLRPIRKDINMFAHFRFFDEGDCTCLAKPKSLFYYIFHIKNAKNDFLSCRWKIGFMKRLFIIPLPYARIYRWLLKYK